MSSSLNEAGRSESVTEPVGRVVGVWERWLWVCGICQCCFASQVTKLVGEVCWLAALAFAIAIGVAVGVKSSEGPPTVIHVTVPKDGPAEVANKPCGCGKTPTPLAAVVPPKGPLVPVPNVPVEAVFRR